MSVDDCVVVPPVVVGDALRLLLDDALADKPEARAATGHVPQGVGRGAAAVAEHAAVNAIATFTAGLLRG